MESDALPGKAVPQSQEPARPTWLQCTGQRNEGKAAAGEDQAVHPLLRKCPLRAEAQLNSSSTLSLQIALEWGDSLTNSSAF